MYIPYGEANKYKDDRFLNLVVDLFGCPARAVYGFDPDDWFGESFLFHLYYQTKKMTDS